MKTREKEEEEEEEEERGERDQTHSSKTRCRMFGRFGVSPAAASTKPTAISSVRRISQTTAICR
jgi:hypothetical protein